MRTPPIKASKKAIMSVHFNFKKLYEYKLYGILFLQHIKIERILLYQFDCHI